MKDENLGRILGQDDGNIWGQVLEQSEQIREIRLRIGRPVLIRRAGGDCFLGRQGQFTDQEKEAYRIGTQEMDELFMRICQGSPYAFEDMIRQGFLTAPGGHRVGLAGQVVAGEDGEIRTIKHLYYANIRISHQVRGAADQILPRLYVGGQVQNTLIISPPGKGKTTLLRELIRRVSDGTPYGRGRNVGVVDERSELAGSYLGKPQNDLGCRTDVLDACPKAQGMLMLLRSMAPEILAVDELGGEGDAQALRSAAVCGTKVIATAHGEGIRDVETRFPGLMADHLFERFVIFREKEEKHADSGRKYDPERVSGTWIVVPEQNDRQTARAENAVKAAGDVLQ